MQSTTNGGKALDRAFSFLLWGNQEEERKSVHFCSINAKGMLIFIVADIWNCYNMDMKKATNLKVLIIFKQPHCMEIRGMWLFPFYLAALAALMLVMTEALNRSVAAHPAQP